METNPILFIFKDYKAYIRARIDASESPRGLISAYADAAGCQRTYFSQVINSHVQLTPDHALGLVEYWRLPEAEARYFCLLVDLARAATVRLQNKISTQLEEIKRNQENLAKRFGQKAIEPGEKELIFLSSWHYAAVHMLTSVPQFQSAEKIAERLGLPIVTVTQALEQLEKHGFVKREKKRYVHSAGNIHIPKTSLLNSINHGNWRSQAVTHSQNPDNGDVHYTAVSSFSYEDFEKLKNLLLEFIEQTRKVMATSPGQDVFCFTSDLFKV